MPKGGAKSAQLHNEKVKKALDNWPEVVVPAPVVETAAAGVRASARPLWWYGFGVGVGGSSVAWVVGLIIGGVY